MNFSKKLLGALLALALLIATGSGVLAADPTGTITINSGNNVSVGDRTFEAYRILDVTAGSGVDPLTQAYTVPKALETFYAGAPVSVERNDGETDASYGYRVANKIKEWESNSTALFEFATAAAKAAKNAKITPISATGAGGKAATFTDVPLGYYVIVDTTNPAAEADEVVSALMLQTVGTVNITIKADQPSIDKKITNSNGNEHHNNAAIGGTVNFELSSTVPKMDGYNAYTYTVTDTFSKGLDLVKSDGTVVETGDAKNAITVTIGGTKFEELQNKGTADYTATYTKNTDGTKTLVINFSNFLALKGYAGQAIKIAYSATVNENAVIGTAGNLNTVYLEYSNDPNDTTSKGKTPESTTYTYVTGIQLKKTDATGDAPLAGATVKITGTPLETVVTYTTDKGSLTNPQGPYYLAGGTYTTEKPAEGATEYWRQVNTKPAGTVEYTVTTGADGIVSFEGLKQGQYEISEVAAPEGYQLFTGKITVNISCTVPEQTTGDQKCTWNFDVTGAQSYVSSEIQGNTLLITLKNGRPGELPSTGATMHKGLYIAGGVMLAAALVLILARRKAQAQK